MGLLDAFTGANAKNAGRDNAQWATQVYGRQEADMRNRAQNAVDDINKGLWDGQGQYVGQQQKGLDALAGAYAQGRSDLGTGFERAVATLDPYARAGGAASTMYSNSLGLNGADGNAAATSAFQASPGYQWQVDQATDAAARKANSLGMAASGNTLAALTTLGQNLANQEYSGWQDRLNGLGQQGFQASQGIANAATGLGQGLAGLGQAYGQNAASLYGKGASDLLNSGLTAEQLKSNVWNNLNNVEAGFTSNFMNLATNSNMEGAKAADAANGNMWGAIGGLASNIFGAAGKAGGFGSLFS